MCTCTRVYVFVRVPIQANRKSGGQGTAVIHKLFRVLNRVPYPQVFRSFLVLGVLLAAPLTTLSLPAEDTELPQDQEDLPESEALRRRPPWRARPTFHIERTTVRKQEAPLSADIYTSALNSIQQEKLPLQGPVRLLPHSTLLTEYVTEEPPAEEEPVPQGPIPGRPGERRPFPQAPSQDRPLPQRPLANSPPAQRPLPKRPTPHRPPSAQRPERPVSAMRPVVRRPSEDSGQLTEESFGLLSSVFRER